MVLSNGTKKNTNTNKKINYLKYWPPSFVPAATGSARTPLGPIRFMSLYGPITLDMLDALEEVIHYF